MTPTRLTWLIAALWLVIPPPSAACADGAIAGHVRDAGSGRPIRLARVEISGSALGDNIVVLTDDRGRFGPVQVPAGRYLLSVGATGYAPVLFGGATAGIERPVAVVLADSEIFDNADVDLKPGGVIDGRLMDGDGAAVTGVRVYALLRRPGAPNDVRVRTIMSDDRGAFRLWDLPEGDYYLRAERTVHDVRTSRDALIAETTYYPAAELASLASPIHVAAGEEITGVAMFMRRSPSATISGVVQDSAGRRVTVQRVAAFAIGDNTGRPLAEAPLDKNGRFQFGRLPVGPYTITALCRDGDGVLCWGTIDVELSAEGVAGAHIVVASAPALSGVVTGVSLTTRSQVRVVASDERGSDWLNGIPENGVVRADGRFSLVVTPGRKQLAVTGLSGSHAVSAIRLGTDAMRDVQLMAGTVRTDLVIEMRPLTAISGHVVDAGTPVMGAVVAVLAAATESAPPALAALERTNQRGEFLMSVPAGVCRIAAFRMPPGESWPPPVSAILPVSQPCRAPMEGLTIDLTQPGAPKQP